VLAQQRNEILGGVVTMTDGQHARWRGAIILGQWGEWERERQLVGTLP
jgi:hypothetical protein